MAGDWIKMRGNLWDDPRVSKLCDLCDCGEAQAVGGLYWLWATADQHTEDGRMPGLSLRQIDRKTGIQGFGAALCEIGWLEDDPQGVVIINFEEHNGASAKKRAVTSKRVANHRAGNAGSTQDHDDGDVPVTQQSLQQEHASVTGALAREREEIEEEKKKDTSSEKIVGAAGAASTKPDTTDTKGSRLPTDWQLPKAWGDWALAEYPHWTPEVVRFEAQKFADHWRAQPGKDGRKSDWSATWRNWCRNDICQKSHPLQGATRPSKRNPMTDDERAAWTAAQGEQARRLLFGDAPPAADLIDITPEGITHEAV